jgi:hypothetical protein
MEAMLLGLGADKGPSSSSDGASASDGANAGDEPARDKLFLAAWEDLIAKSMADISPEVAGGSESDVAGEPKDAFRKSRDEAAERLRKSDAELHEVTRSVHMGETEHAKSPSRRRPLQQMTSWPPCLSPRTRPRCKSSLRV